MPIERINPPELAQTTKGTHVVKAGNTVYIRGQVAVDVVGNIVGADDFATQLHQTFENIRLCLSSVGASMENVVQANVYLVREEDLEPYRQLRANYWAGGQGGVLAVIKALAMPEYLVEISAIAVLD